MAVNDFGQDDTSRITAYLHTPSVVISEGHPLDLDAVIAHFNERVAGFTRRGSGYVLAWIDQLSASFLKLRPLGAGSFVSTPQWIVNKQAVVNIRNQGQYLPTLMSRKTLGILDGGRGWASIARGGVVGIKCMDPSIISWTAK